MNQGCRFPDRSRRKNDRLSFTKDVVNLSPYARIRDMQWLDCTKRTVRKLTLASVNAVFNRKSYCFGIGPLSGNL
jgi:hypothetical protein